MGSRLHRVFRNGGRTLADDALTSIALEPRFFGHAGFPEATDALAYDPVQRLLAVRKSDPRHIPIHPQPDNPFELHASGKQGIFFFAPLHVLTAPLHWGRWALPTGGSRCSGRRAWSACSGRPRSAPPGTCASWTARAPCCASPMCATPSRILSCLPSLRNACMTTAHCATGRVPCDASMQGPAKRRSDGPLWVKSHVVQDGDLQLWGVAAGGLLDTLPGSGDEVMVLEPVQAQEPYVLLGCRSGRVAVAALLNESGAPATGAQEARTLCRAPYNSALLRRTLQPLCACSGLLKMPSSLSHRTACLLWIQWRLEGSPNWYIAGASRLILVMMPGLAVVVNRHDASVVLLLRSPAGADARRGRGGDRALRSIHCWAPQGAGCAREHRRPRVGPQVSSRMS